MKKFPKKGLRMGIEPIDREIPQRLLDYMRREHTEALVAHYMGRYDEAERRFRRQYEVLLEAQEEEKRPIHKGKPLYNLGISLFMQERTQEAAHNVLLAYIEDALSQPYDSEDEADRLDAAAVLRDIFRIRLRLLREIKALSASKKQAGLWSQLRDPAELLQEVFEKEKIDPNNLLTYCDIRITPGKTMPLGFPQPREQRVFIGANYDTHGHVIPEIKEVVLRKGYTPIILYEVSIPPERIHHNSLMLLHTCAYAIIDITSPAGQYMEIERAHDYNVKVLPVRSALDKIKFPPHISSMIKTLDYPVKLYRDVRELRQIVDEFLP